MGTRAFGVLAATLAVITGGIAGGAVAFTVFALPAVADTPVAQTVPDAVAAIERSMAAPATRAASASTPVAAQAAVESPPGAPAATQPATKAGRSGCGRHRTVLPGSDLGRHARRARPHLGGRGARHDHRRPRRVRPGLQRATRRPLPHADPARELPVRRLHGAAPVLDGGGPEHRSAERLGATSARWRSDGLPSVGCDGNLAGGYNNVGETFARKWWDSLGHRISVYNPDYTGSVASVCIYFAVSHGGVPDEPYAFTRAPRRAGATASTGCPRPTASRPGPGGNKLVRVTQRLRWGVLGTGWIADQMTADLAVLGSPVTAVGSRAQATADAFASRYGIPNAHPTYRQLVEDPEVDVVYVATPHPSHHADTKLALEAGKHVLVEKSFTVNAAEARDLVELAAERGLVVLEAMWTRWLPHMVRIRELIDSGALGDVRTLIADHTQKLSADPAHRIQNPELGGGALLDLGIYPVSFAWDVFGAPTTIQAISSPTATGVDRQTAMLFGYADGQQAVMHCALDTQGPNAAVILGTEARIEIDPVWYTPTTFRLISPDDEVLEEFDGRGPGRGMQFQAAALEELVAAGALGGDVLPPAESVAIMESLDEVRAQIGLRYPGEA